MTKTRQKRRAAAPPRSGNIPWGGPAGTSGRIGLVLGVVVLAAALAVAYVAWRAMADSGRFDALVERGQPALDQVQTLPSEGQDHLRPGERHGYGVPFPLSGPHDPSWVEPGVYDAPQPPTRLVHALEHGNIVIYVDAPSPDALDLLRHWAARFDDPWAGLVVVPAAGLDDAVVLTAWRRILRLDPFDPAAAAAFIDAYRGRGPENPVR